MGVSKMSSQLGTHVFQALSQQAAYSEVRKDLLGSLQGFRLGVEVHLGIGQLSCMLGMAPFEQRWRQGAHVKSGEARAFVIEGLVVEPGECIYGTHRIVSQTPQGVPWYVCRYRILESRGASGNLLAICVYSAATG